MAHPSRRQVEPEEPEGPEGSEGPEEPIGPGRAGRHSHSPSHGHGHGHGHAVSATADRRWLGAALALIVGFMAIEVVIGLIAESMALISDAGHMLTDAFSIVLALFAMHLAIRPPMGGFTFGLKRAEILSAQVNGLTLILLAAFFGYESIRRLVEPADVAGGLVFATALVGIGVNLLAAWLIGRADRRSLNVEGAFQHILTDLYAFIATAVAGLVVWLTGFGRADAIAALVVVVLMLRSGYGLLRDAGRVLMEAAPVGIDPGEIGRRLAERPCVREVHDLHVWEVTSGYPAMSAHVLVDPGGDCHGVRRDLQDVLGQAYGITHTTLQVDHMPEAWVDAHCDDAHGPRHVAAPAVPHEHADDPYCGH